MLGVILTVPAVNTTPVQVSPFNRHQAHHDKALYAAFAMSIEGLASSEE